MRNNLAVDSQIKADVFGKLKATAFGNISPSIRSAHEKSASAAIRFN